MSGGIFSNHLRQTLFLICASTFAFVCFKLFPVSKSKANNPFLRVYHVRNTKPMVRNRIIKVRILIVIRTNYNKMFGYVNSMFVFFFRVRNAKLKVRVRNINVRNISTCRCLSCLFETFL